ncbi:hypothetical protein F4861DRAFT_547033 [Xylaria intraflava]|nr:hypothetical protein F4861DRAFT_547033 [Xylaria intraflava]
MQYSKSGIKASAAVFILIPLATIAVALRFWSRRLTKIPFWLDDYLALAALIIHHGLTAVGFALVFKGGLGLDYPIVVAEGPEAIIFLYKFLYVLSSPLIKLAVLVFLWRTFPTTTVRVGCIILSFLSIGWCISGLFINFFQCRPLRAFWHTELQALPGTHCIDSLGAYLGTSVANSFIDLATVTLPIQEIIKLRISTARKFAVCGVFLLGGIAFAASLIRTISLGIIATQKTSNFTKQFLLPGMATSIEIYAGIVGACLPLLMPVYRKLRYGDVFEGKPRRPGDAARNADSTAPTTGDCSRKRVLRPRQLSLEQLLMYSHGGDNAVLGSPSNYQVEARSLASKDLESGHNMSTPLQAIVVKKDIELSTRSRDRLGSRHETST